MNDYDDDDDCPRENLAQTLARELPQPVVLFADYEPAADGQTEEERSQAIRYVAMPKGFDLKAIDSEALREHPRRTQAQARFGTGDSFLDYVKRHATPATVVWCDFDPQSARLAFTAVIDEHAPQAAGWRAHQAKYLPELSHEWKTWAGANQQVKSQMDFAAFIERNEVDIASVEGLPSSLAMMQLATEFEASSEKRIKSVVRLQSGGMKLEYVDDDDANTITAMRLFDRFAIGIPVFWQGAPYRIDARLKYRQASGKVSFWYELIRPDRVHDAASRELIDIVRAAIAPTPLLLGSCA